MRLNSTATNIRQLSLPEPAEETTKISIQLPHDDAADESAHEAQVQPTEQKWFEETYGMTANFYQECMDRYGEGKGDPAAMQALLLEVETYLSFELAKVRKPQVDVASSWDPIAQCRRELTRLYEYASILHEELMCDTEELLPPVDKKTRAAQGADRDVELRRGEWEKQGWGKLNTLKNPYTLMTWRGLQFDEKRARTDAYNARYQALVIEEQNRLLKRSKKEDALKMVQSGISRMQWHYEAAKRADSRREAYEAEQKNGKGKERGLLGGFKNVWGSFRKGGLITPHGIVFDEGQAYEEELRDRLDEVQAARKFGRKTTTAA